MLTFPPRRVGPACRIPALWGQAGSPAHGLSPGNMMAFAETQQNCLKTRNSCVLFLSGFCPWKEWFFLKRALPQMDFFRTALLPLMW